jgi:signal transduction histidine kinase
MESSGGRKITDALLDVRLSRTRTALLALVLTLLAAWGDAATGSDATFTLFYVVPLAVAVWFGDRRTGAAVALLATLGGIAGRLLDRPRISLVSIGWNAVAELTLYLAGAWLLDALRARLEAEALARRDVVGQLRHAERLTTVGKLASGIAHELGTPLNVIAGHAELLAAGGLGEDAVRTSARIVLDQTERVSTIIRQLLDFARRGGARPEITNLTELARVTVALLRPLAARSHVTIECVGPNVSARVNRAELEQVITNLVTNAMQAMPSGGAVHVDLYREETHAPGRRETERRGYAVLAVSDEGLGIPSDVLPKVFDPFFTTKDVGRGTGLGLSVAYGIVQDHHGWISINTGLGHGTTVTVHLPA